MSKLCRKFIYFSKTRPRRNIRSDLSWGWGCAAVTNVTTPRGLALLKRARRGIEDPELGGVRGGIRTPDRPEHSLCLLPLGHGALKHLGATQQRNRKQTPPKPRRKELPPGGGSCRPKKNQNFGDNFDNRLAAALLKHLGATQQRNRKQHRHPNHAGGGSPAKLGIPSETEKTSLRGI